MRMHRSAAAPAIKANSHLAHIIAITACTYSWSQSVEKLGRANWSRTMTNGQRIRGRYDKPNKESTRWLSVSLFRLNMRKKSGMTVIFHSNIPLAHANTTSVVVIMNKRTYVFRKNTYQKCPLTYGPFSGQKYHKDCRILSLNQFKSKKCGKVGLVRREEAVPYIERAWEREGEEDSQRRFTFWPFFRFHFSFFFKLFYTRFFYRFILFY